MPTTNSNSNTAPTVVVMYQFEGVPANGVLGVGTLAEIAPKGAVVVDITNANLYINAGTQASPVWKLVTRAA
jgi:hypothetical protein